MKYRVAGGSVLRSSIGLVGIAFAAAGALAGSLGSAAAQYYPQPAPPPYAGPPPVYRDANGAPIDSRYVQPAPEEVYFAPQPLPTPEGRPPADVVGAPHSAADVTGSINRPPAATSLGPTAAPQASRPTVVAALPMQSRPEQGSAQELPPQLRRQIANFPTTEPAGTIIIDTPNTYLYLVLGHGKALRYGIGVGREGFTWSGTERISRMKEWPDWFPPKEMIERQPYLPRFMAGGESNPLGARAMYLGNTLYRIHGTNDPSTIGKYISSGCVRLTNEDVEDLYSRVGIGTRVVVLPATMPNAAASETPPVPLYSAASQYPAGAPIPPAPIAR